MNPVSLLPWFAALTGALAIASADWALGAEWLNFVFKPLTTLLLIAWAWPRGGGDPMRPWLRAGLGLSLIGDVALMWPQSGFLPGLVSFLLAHLCYIVAFTRHSRLGARPVWLVGYGAVAAAVLGMLWPGVPAALRGPVVLYVVALALMAAQAAIHWRAIAGDADGTESRLARANFDGESGSAAGRQARFAAIGGALFLLSDALLATNRFYQPLQASGLWILLSYWLAQACIAGSLRAGAARP